MSSNATEPSGRGDAIHALVDHVVSSRYESLSQGAVDTTKAFILDSFAAALAGTLAPEVSGMLGMLNDWGGKPESTVWVSGERLPAPSAAMMNSLLMHNQEFDCVHDLAVVHAFTSALPAALAVAQAKGMVTGRELLTAVALGVDVSCSIGIASRSPMAHYRPATAGAFGAVAAAGKIAGFGQAALANAMGIVYSQISGTLQPHYEGAQVIVMQIAFNTRAAVTAVSLAGRGITGASAVLEGRYGYFPLYEGDYDIEDVLANLGRVWQVERICHKPFPTGRLTHGAIEAALSLKDQYGFAAADVLECEVIVPPLVHRLVGRSLDSGVPSPQYARLSIPFVVSVALVRGKVFVNDFGEEGLADPAIHELAGRIKVVQDPNIRDENAMVPLMVRIRLKDGTEHEMTLHQMTGHPDKPMKKEQQLGKFHACWEVGAGHLPGGNRDRLADLVDGLEEAPSVEDLVSLIVP